MPVEQMLTVNISPRTVEAPHFSADALMSLLGRYSIAPDRVVVELTEREKVEDLNRLQANLGALQRLGLRIAADDVGAGNAGLRLLSLFRFDVVKIDLSLVQRGSDDQTNSVLRSIVEVANRMNASTTAEGVETSGQLRAARRLGITNGQGYLLGRPGPERDLTWVDIAALEQRDDVGIPIRDLSDQAMPPRSLAARIGEFPDPDLPPPDRGLTAAGAKSGMKLPSIAFLKASRQQQSE